MLQRWADSVPVKGEHFTGRLHAKIVPDEELVTRDGQKREADTIPRAGMTWSVKQGRMVPAEVGLMRFAERGFREADPHSGLPVAAQRYIMHEIGHDITQHYRETAPEPEVKYPDWTPDQKEMTRRVQDYEAKMAVHTGWTRIDRLRRDRSPEMMSHTYMSAMFTREFRNVTPYANTSVEEAFCEALSLRITNGRRFGPLSDAVWEFLGV